jgi:hypothetical protein
VIERKDVRTPETELLVHMLVMVLVSMAMRRRRTWGHHGVQR